MSLVAIIALAATAAAFVAGLAYKAGAGTAAGKAIGALPDNPIDLHNTALNYAEGLVMAALKHVLTGPLLQSFLQFLSTGPSPAGILVWLESNVGAGFLSQIVAGLPAVVQVGLQALGGALPTVVGGLIAKVAPLAAHQNAQAQITSAQVLAGLTAASNVPAPALAPKAA